MRSDLLPTRRLVAVVLLGSVAGLASGLLGVGGGIVMVPLLTMVIGISQHAAHATSLAAIIPIAVAGAFTFGVAGAVDYRTALLLAAGSLIGAPLGARVMSRSAEWQLKMMFGALLSIVGVQLLLP